MSDLLKEITNRIADPGRYIKRAFEDRDGVKDYEPIPQWSARAVLILLNNKIEEVTKPRIYTRCPACFNDTLTINKGKLLCTWHECPDPIKLHRECMVKPEDRDGN